MFFSSSFISRSFLIVSLIVFLGLTLPLVTPLHLIYSPYYIIHRSSLYMHKPPKSSFYHLFSYRCYPHSLSNVIISNYILSSLTTHPTQHPHLCYAYFMFVLVLYRPTLCPVQHFPFNLCSTLVSHKTPRHSSISNNIVTNNNIIIMK